MGVRALSWGLRIWALLQVYAAALWVVGPFGVGAGGWTQKLLPDWLSQPLSYGLQGHIVGPITGVLLTNRGAYSQIGDLSLRISGNQGTRIVPGGSTFGDIDLDTTAQFSQLSGVQGWVWVLLHVVSLLTLAALWGLLAQAVAQSRTAPVFTRSNAWLLSIAGAVVAIGSIVLSVLTHWFYTWVAQSSQIASLIRVPGYGWHSVPWPAVVAGAAMLVLGEVWRRGVALETELGGLV